MWTSYTYFSGTQAEPVFWVKEEEEGEMNMQGQVIGMVHPMVEPCELTLEERCCQQWEKYPPPDNPPPGLPQALTAPHAMNPTAVGFLHGTILMVS